MAVANIHIGPAWLWTAATIFPFVCVLVVGTRMISRHRRRIPLGADDWCVVPALIIVLGMAATILVGVATRSLGHATPKVEGTSQLAASSRQQTITRKAFFIITLISTPALAFIKLSCVFFYDRVFSKASGRIVNGALRGLIALIIIWGCGFFFAWLFGCGTHFDYYWTSQENQLKCPADLAKINLSLAISNFLLDTIIILFPIPLILKLQMSRVNKLAILVVFALGGLAVAASVTRMVIIVEELNVQFAMTVDPNFASTAAIYFIYIEACFALCAVSLPSLSSLLKVGVQEVGNMIDGFTMALSNLSWSSRGSRGSRGSRRPRASTVLPNHHEPHERLGSQQASKEELDLVFDPRQRDGHGSHAAVQGGDVRVEEVHMGTLYGKDDVIHVTRSVDLNSLRR